MPHKTSSRRWPSPRLNTRRLTLTTVSDEATALEAVNGVLERLVSLLRSRDLAGILQLFAEDAILFGSEAQEIACGTSQLEMFFESILSQPMTILWTWELLFARKSGNTIWFVGPATLRVLGDARGEQTYPYRLSGVLTRQPHEEWVFAMFNGSEPAQR